MQIFDQRSLIQKLSKSMQILALQARTAMLL